MTTEEAIQTIETAIAEVEWNYPMDYAVAFEAALTALRAKQEAEQNEPPTNADRIRAMSDEELAHAIRCPLVIRGIDAFPICHEHDSCQQRTLNWLQQPAEEV